MIRSQGFRFAAFAAAVLFALGGSAARADDAAGAPTFSKDVMPLLQEHCQSCHRPGEAAPMTLMDYKSARPWVKSIRKQVSEKVMPPWHADPRYGHFANDRRLSDAQIATFVQWADAGAPEGNPADLPPAREFVEGWGIGKPDLVLTVTEEQKVPATGIIPYRDLVFPPFPEDRWVSKLEIRPRNRNVAHHINVFRTLPGGDGKEEEFEQGQNEKGGKSKKEFVTGFVPGGIVTEYPEGTAVFWPKGTVIHLQAHYVTTGKEETDMPSVGFVFARKSVDKQVYNFLISNYGFTIPPGDPNFEVKATWRTPRDSAVTLIGTMVHMHLRGKDYSYNVKYPDGREDVLMAVPKYDFNWQMGYVYKDRPTLPPKTVVEGVAHMDNSPGNPFNPDPKASVKYGPQTFDEMVMGFVFYTKDNEHIAETTGKEHLGPLDAQVGGTQGASKSSGAGN